MISFIEPINPQHFKDIQRIFIAKLEPSPIKVDFYHRNRPDQPPPTIDFIDSANPLYEIENLLGRPTDLLKYLIK